MLIKLLNLFKQFNYLQIIINQIKCMYLINKIHNLITHYLFLIQLISIKFAFEFFLLIRVLLLLSLLVFRIVYTVYMVCSQGKLQDNFQPDFEIHLYFLFDNIICILTIGFSNNLFTGNSPRGTSPSSDPPMSIHDNYIFSLSMSKGKLCRCRLFLKYNKLL